VSPRYKLDEMAFAPKGDGEADDTLPFLDVVRKLPNGSVVMWPEDFKMRWTDTVVPPGQNRVRFICAADPRDIAQQEPHAGIIYDGRPGNDLLVLDSCRRWYFEGIAFSATPHNEAVGGANRVLVFDELSPNARDISSRVTLKRCQISLGMRNPNGVGISNSMVSGNNCEYPKLDEVKITGGGGGAGLVRWYGRRPLNRDDGISIDQGSNRALANKPGTFRPSDGTTHEAFVIASAFGRLETRITAIISDVEALLEDPAPIKFVKAYATIGEHEGVGFQNGQSFNAKRLQFTDVEIYNCRYGVHSMGGSQQIIQANLGGNEVDFFIEGQQAESSWELGTQSENSRRHLVNLSGADLDALAQDHGGRDRRARARDRRRRVRHAPRESSAPTAPRSKPDSLAARDRYDQARARA
jgi:hypothetical protein